MNLRKLRLTVAAAVTLIAACQDPARQQSSADPKRNRRPKPPVVDDPAVRPPPRDGTPITVATVREGISRAPGKWDGQKTRVKARFIATTMTLRHGKPSITVSIGDDVTRADQTLGCALAAGETAPDLFQGRPVLAVGTISAARNELLSCKLIVLDNARPATSKGKTATPRSTTDTSLQTHAVPKAARPQHQSQK